MEYQLQSSSCGVSVLELSLWSMSCNESDYGVSVAKSDCGVLTVKYMTMEY